MAAMPAEGAPASGAEGNGPFLQLASNVMKGLSLLGEGLQKAGAPEEALAKLSEVVSGFQGFMAELSGEGGGEEPQPQKPQVSPVQEQQGRPVSPAGV